MQKQDPSLPEHEADERPITRRQTAVYVYEAPLRLWHWITVFSIFTLLMGAENPQMYKVLGLANIDYNDMIPISILARGTPIFVARNDAPFNSLSEYVEYAKAHPNDIKVGSTGPGGLTSIVIAMLDAQVKLKVTHVPYDGDGPALTALQGGAIDIMPVVLGAAIEHIKAGRMKVIGLVDTQPNPMIPKVAPITETFPDMAKLLPWGPFFGVFVKKGTPDDVVEKLTQAYKQGAESDDFKALMDKKGFTVLAASGSEAEAFLTHYRSVSSWIVYEAGMAKKSPEAFGITKPE
jgi:tripartite-type tricarboxylate transporter receptor subunit TctC